MTEIEQLRDLAKRTADPRRRAHLTRSAEILGLLPAVVDDDLRIGLKIELQERVALLSR